MSLNFFFQVGEQTNKCTQKITLHKEMLHTEPLIFIISYPCVLRFFVQGDIIRKNQLERGDAMY